MIRKRPDLISSLPPLFPETIIDPQTGEMVEQIEFSKNLEQLALFVQRESQRLWKEYKETLEETLATITASSPAEIGRQAGLSVDLNQIPREVKAKSRIERLVRYQAITSAKSYYKSPLETKQEPSFSPYLNLGAVDASMVIIKWVENKIELLFKCWDREYLLIFKIPDYILTRKVQKITLPVIKPFGNDWGFLFSVHEISSVAICNNDYVIGVDLGRVEPYTLAVVHAKTGSMVARYTASPRLRLLVNKKNRLNQELAHMWAKSTAHRALGFTNEVLELERVRTRNKRNRIMDKITWLIATEIEVVAERFSPRFVAQEDLSWVSSKHGMSRWTHSKDQSAITHKLTRSGRVTKKVSPKNTSQECHKCGERIIHKSGKRLVVCNNCMLTIDRDVNAAINIALRPLRKRSKGNNCTESSEVIGVPNSNKRLQTDKGLKSYATSKS